MFTIWLVNPFLFDLGCYYLDVGESYVYRAEPCSDFLVVVPFSLDHSLVAHYPIQVNRLGEEDPEEVGGLSEARVPAGLFLVGCLWEETGVRILG